mmetsp:Transcript_38333/g.39007  ORF Transcript_38333/g.39007 Transcript_38333/m.39007 type:complete len:336 (-) Transcript_38333:298-1305(-)
MIESEEVCGAIAALSRAVTADMKGLTRNCDEQTIRSVPSSSIRQFEDISDSVKGLAIGSENQCLTNQSPRTTCASDGDSDSDNEDITCFYNLQPLSCQPSNISRQNHSRTLSSYVSPLTSSMYLEDVQISVISTESCYSDVMNSKSEQKYTLLNTYQNNIDESKVFLTGQEIVIIEDDNNNNNNNNININNIENMFDGIDINPQVCREKNSKYINPSEMLRLYNKRVLELLIGIESQILCLEDCTLGIIENQNKNQNKDHNKVIDLADRLSTIYKRLKIIDIFKNDQYDNKIKAYESQAKESIIQFNELKLKYFNMEMKVCELKLELAQLKDILG